MKYSLNSRQVLTRFVAIVLVVTLLAQQVMAGVNLSLHQPAIAGTAVLVDEPAFDTLSIIKFFNWI